NEVVGPEQLTEGASADSIHGTGLEVHEDSARDILVTRGLGIRRGKRKYFCHQQAAAKPAWSCNMGSYLVEVHAHALKLELRRAIVPKRRGVSIHGNLCVRPHAAIPN